MNLKIALEKIADRENIGDPCMKNSSEHTKGRGYLGDITAVQISGTGKGGEDIVLNVIIKSVTTNDKLREMSGMDKVYEREMFIYDTVLPALHKFEEEKGIVNPVITDLIPKCYGVLRADKQETLIFEDLKDTGYQVWDRTKEMEDQHVRMVFAEYGRLHAISFAVEAQEPNMFQKLTDKINNVYYLFLEKSDILKNFVYYVKKAEASLDPNLDKDALKVYKTLSDNVGEIFKKLICSSEKHQVILHGDSWSNNMMFKYEDIHKPGRPTSMRLFDFQLARMASPVCDLVFFFYTCTSKEVLENLNTYLNVYYESLSSNLKYKFGLKSEEVFPLSTLKEHWRKYAKLGLIQAAFCRYLLLSEENEAVNLDEVVESGKNLTEGFTYEIANKQKYNERMRNVILHCAKNNFI